MASPLDRISSLDILHPTFREKLDAVLVDLNAANLPFQVFESYRTPERQAHLYAKGRTTPGPKVTNANAWFSYHQYGLAVDMVLKLNGNWSWETKGVHAAQWKQLHQIALRHGLEPLSWELPHLQLQGFSGAELQKGNYPPFGNDAWAENLAAAIAGWAGANAPPVPPTPERPPLDGSTGAGTGAAAASPEIASSDPPLDRPATPTESKPMTSPGTFESIQAMIDKWEGGYVDHPADPGGATNMGITQATLARWRGHSVTKEDVKNLTRTEQRQIMKANYYNVINGDDLAPGVAAVTYNAAILHGTDRAARFLQTVVQRRQPSIKVDGAIGPLTIAAARAITPATIVTEFIDLELSYLKGLSHWATFGKGWTNRLTDIRNFALKLGTESMSPFPSDPGSALFVTPDPSASEPSKQGALGVDNMLGQTLGNLLVGKKTTIGGIGTLLSVLAPELGPLLGLDAGQMGTLKDTVLPLALTMLGWGGLGKLDRWVKLLAK